MCGLCGKIHLDPARPIDRALITAMNGRLHHRGPDEDGLHLKGNAALAHKRLSIIDLSTGAQPIYNEDRTCCIVFNGEIYNHHELRERLQARGHKFRTRSDTETILHLYEDSGERCVEELRGMFAFAIWNEPRQELLLARDRVGKKPLFYAETAAGLLFGSELKSLLADPDLPREIDFAALDDALTLQYIPAPRTIFTSVQKLPPAHTLRWNAGRVTLRQYWQLSYEPKCAISEADACELVREKLDEAVRLRLESEVPLGFLLSGGIDSSAVVALARRHFAGDLRTFSIGFEEASHNELPHARVVAERFGTIHEEFVVRPAAAEVLPQLVWHFDEPYGDPSALPSYYVAQMTRRQVTVALNGDGGDESFAGYTRYGGRLVKQFSRVPAPLRRLGRTVGRLGGSLAPGSATLERLKYLSDLSFASDAHQYAYVMAVCHAEQRARLYAGELREVAANRDPLHELARHYDAPRLRADIDRKMLTDIMTYLPGDLLVKMDRMCMAHSLEARSPFLDHVLMETAARLPAEIKFRDGEPKYLLKRALEPVLPREILYRRKQGFAVPLADWFRGDLRTPLYDLLLSDRARHRGYFSMRAVERMVRDHVTGKRNHHHRLWSLLCLEIWCRTFVDRGVGCEGPIKL